MVPAIVYGDEKETINIKLKLNELTKASENELFIHKYYYQDR